MHTVKEYTEAATMRGCVFGAHKEEKVTLVEHSNTCYVTGFCTTGIGMDRYDYTGMDRYDYTTGIGMDHTTGIGMDYTTGIGMENGLITTGFLEWTSLRCQTSTKGILIPRALNLGLK